MKVTKKHDVYGEIVYEEGAWSGKKSLSINGKSLQKVDKTNFTYENGEEKINVKIEGNYLTGTSLNIKNEKIEITPKIKWYETVCSVMIFLLICIWGNVAALCEIVPVVGGAIGGLISGIFAMLNLFSMKLVKNVGLKLLIWLGYMGLTFLDCWGVALIILSM